MTLINAVKTGKKFYRRSWLDKTPISFEDLHKLSKEAFIANDWEVEPEVFVYSREECINYLHESFEHHNITEAFKNSLIQHITPSLTRKQFDDAWCRAKVKYAGDCHFIGLRWDDDSVYKILIKELGL